MTGTAARSPRGKQFFLQSIGVVAVATVMSGVALFAGLPIAAGAEAAPATSATATAQAAGSLTLSPVGLPGTYFAVTLAPASTTTYKVSLSNPGAAVSDFRTYAADIYTIADGGLGARLNGQPQTGTTRWLSYPTATGSLEAGHAQVRSFDITVPAQTKPGQYTTSLVIEDETPKPVGGAEGLSQTIRSVIAVSIVVPGHLKAAYSIGNATVVSSTPAGHSSHTALTIPLANTGNMLVRPAGTIRILRLDGTQVFTAPIVLGSVYAGTATTVSVSLTRTLPKGVYTVQLALKDKATGVSAAAQIQTISLDGARAPAPSPWQRTVFIALFSIATVGLVAAVLVLRLLRRRRTVTGVTSAPANHQSQDERVS